jgi:hypothetical protein
LLDASFPVESSNATENAKQLLKLNGEKITRIYRGELAFRFKSPFPWNGVKGSAEQKFVDSLQLPWIRDQPSPLMEAFQLGYFRDEPVLNKRVHDLFQQGQNTYVLTRCHDDYVNRNKMHNELIWYRQNTADA